MAAYRFPAAENETETVISRFGGADFRSHPAKAPLSRSPDMKNLISEQNGFLVKRTGYKTLSRFSAPVYGIFALAGGACIVHAGDELYHRAPGGALTRLCGDMNEAFSQAFSMGGTLWLLDGKTFRAVRKNEAGAWEAVPVRDLAYVPTTTVSAAPTGGGAGFEAANLLTPRRINTFIGSGSATQFQVDAKELDDAEVTAEVDGEAAAVASVNRETGLVTLASAPPNGSGLANVSIAFSKTVPGSADKIDRCRIAGLYGGKNDTRVFLSGNPDEPNCDWQSGLYDPSYFPDTGYTRMGTEAGAIIGYLKQYDSQIIVKAPGTQEAATFLRTYLAAEDGSALYPLKQGAQGDGACAPRSFAALNDTPLFLSPRGVMGIFGTAVAEQRNLRSVSGAVSPRLTQETGLENACAAVFEGRYYLAVNGHVYVADGSLTEEDGDPAWFYWTNVPAACMAEVGGRLWFGTEDGRLCRFSQKGEDGAYSDDETAIDACWRAPTLAFSGWGRNGTVRDVTASLIPYARSGAYIRYEGEGGAESVFSRNVDLFSFRSFSFSRFSFRCIPNAVSFRTRRKKHKTPFFAVSIGNDRPGEPFGLLALTIRCTRGGTII